MVDAIVIAMVVIAAGILWLTRRRAPKAKPAAANSLIAEEDAAHQTSPPSQPLDADPRAFEPDGVYSGIPFKVRDGGEIEAMLTDGVVVFRDFNQFINSVKGKTTVHSE
jgi:hypothetical protein